MRRKILMGVLALALPMGTVAAFSPVATAGAPQNPISCTGFTGTVEFGTALHDRRCSYRQQGWQRHRCGRNVG